MVIHKARLPCIYQCSNWLYFGHLEFIALWIWICFVVFIQYFVKIVGFRFTQNTLLLSTQLNPSVTVTYYIILIAKHVYIFFSDIVCDFKGNETEADIRFAEARCRNHFINVIRPVKLNYFILAQLILCILHYGFIGYITSYVSPLCCFLEAVLCRSLSENHKKETSDTGSKQERHIDPILLPYIKTSFLVLVYPVVHFLFAGAWIACTPYFHADVVTSSSFSCDAENDRHYAYQNEIVCTLIQSGLWHILVLLNTTVCFVIVFFNLCQTIRLSRILQTYGNSYIWWNLLEHYGIVSDYSDQNLSLLALSVSFLDENTSFLSNNYYTPQTSPVTTPNNRFSVLSNDTVFVHGNRRRFNATTNSHISESSV